MFDSGQHVLSVGGNLLAKEANGEWLHDFLIPAYAAGVSAVVLLAQAVIVKVSVSKGSDAALQEPVVYTRLGYVARFRAHVTRLGGPAIYAFESARLLACLGLMELSIFTAVSFDIDHSRSEGNALRAEWILFGLCATFVYSSCLAFMSVAARPSWNRVASKHLDLLLLVPWLVFAYRDLWPLATFTLTPVDAAEGWIIWTKLGLLTFAAVFVPLFVPRQYIPLDPKNPQETVSAEQTASLMSSLLFSYLDPVIFEAFRVPHLGIDRLPPLTDQSYTQNLAKRCFPDMDPLLLRRNRYIFWSIINVFLVEHLVMCLLLVMKVLTNLAAPFGINRLLRYIETGGENAVVRPWVWIAWLFLSPTLGTIVMQWHDFLTTTVAVQCQSALTQLIFHHALRIRVKAEVGESPHTTDDGLAVAPTPESSSFQEQEQNLEQEPSGTQEDATRNTDNEAPATASVTTTSTVGKAKEPIGDKPASTRPAGQSSNFLGKINNIVTSDISALQEGHYSFLFVAVYVPTQISLTMLFLYSMLGWSIFAGIGVIIISLPVPGLFARLLQNVQREKMKQSDARVQTVTETMGVIRMVKLFGWEPKMSARLADKRQYELKFVRKEKLLELLNNNINMLIPVLTMVATYTAYTVVMKQQLTASQVFASMAAFEILQEHFSGIFHLIPVITRGKVSLDRIHEFLQETELLDEFTERSEPRPIPVAEPGAEVVGIRAASFTWAHTTDGTKSPGGRNFVLRIEDEVFFKRGQVNLIIGPTGAGKTSVLMALLGEMHYTPMGPDSMVCLPRDGGVAYHAQESWVLNDTIRNNILFGAPYNEERYNAVIEQCALIRDLGLFGAGDLTEVGEKGLTLSGGQKARVTLARAVYSSAQILLLDDVLAALDVHTARWIVDECFKGDLVRGRTIILVTHNVAMVAPIADFVVSLGTDGRVLSQGSLSAALSRDEKLSAQLAAENREIKKAKSDVDPPEPGIENKTGDGKLIIAEEIAEGHVSWPALKLYFASMSSGRMLWLFWTFFFSTIALSKLAAVLETWVLGQWAAQYEHHKPSEVSVSYWLTLYCGIVAVTFITYAAGYTTFIFGSIRASRLVHKVLIDSILGTTLRWLDKTPASRIIARCTQDIQAVDGPVATFFFFLMDMTFSMLLKLIAVVTITPIFIIPGTALGIAGGACGHVYMRAQLAVKREMSNARAPVLGHISSAIQGLVSIRAYGAQNAFTKTSYDRIDSYTKTAKMFWDLNRWVAIRMDIMGGLFSAGLAAYLVYGGGVGASSTGFSLTMAVGFSATLLWWVRVFNLFEVNGNSLERIQQYVGVEQEAKPTERGIPPAYWPASGDLRVENLSARYSADGPEVLHDITFEIKSGERVGIVGRTGSGKSSLTLALLRCILTEGKVYFDGAPTDSINLDSLRSNITIIPQMPELLSGTLRNNLDPFSQHDDAVLNDALRAAGLFSVQKDTDEGRLALDSQISGGGGNLSVGQRQIIALARAIVRQSKLLILDEATSAIDYETDSVIQRSLREELNKDVTLLTIAHRLQTIMDADKIMVLDAGRIVEFDKPGVLLKNEKGMLRALVDESGDKDILHAMAAAADAA